MHEKTVLEKLKDLNPHLKIYAALNERFSTYGRIIDGFNGAEIINTAETKFKAIDGTSYVASSENLESSGDFNFLQRNIFGEAAIQAGCCWGENLKLNGMEYHRSSEVIGAASPMLLMLGRIQEIENDYWDSGNAECFLLKKGQWIELYSTSLHLAPCRINSEIFRAVIILPRGTNTPLEEGPDETLWMNNKWMLAHPEGPAAKKGAAVRITGENLRLNPLS